MVAMDIDKVEESVESVLNQEGSDAIRPASKQFWRNIDLLCIVASFVSLTYIYCPPQSCTILTAFRES